jgi:hypothetical protein
VGELGQTRAHRQCSRASMREMTRLRQGFRLRTRLRRDKTAWRANDEFRMANFEMMLALKRTAGFFTIESPLANRVIQILSAFNCRFLGPNSR